MTDDAAKLNRRVFIRRVAANTSLAAGAVAAGFAFKGKGLPVTGESETSGREEREAQAAVPGKLAVAMGDG